MAARRARVGALHLAAKGKAVANLDAEVLEAFLERLAADPAVGETVLDGMRAYLSAPRLPSAEQLAQLFASGTGEALA